MLEGMDTDVILAEYQRRAQRAEDLRTAQARLRSRPSSCDALALELGVDIEEIKQRANTRADELTAEQEAEVRRTLAAHTEEWGGPPAPAPDHPAAPDAPERFDDDLEPPPFVQTGPDLFGGGDTPSTASQSMATDAGNNEPEEPPPFLQSGPDLFGVSNDDEVTGMPADPALREIWQTTYSLNLPAGEAATRHLADRSIAQIEEQGGLGVIESERAARQVEIDRAAQTYE